MLGLGKLYIKKIMNIGRDVPDIRIRFTGYTTIFSNPVPGLDTVKMASVTGYFKRILLESYKAPEIVPFHFPNSSCATVDSVASYVI